MEIEENNHNKIFGVLLDLYKNQKYYIDYTVKLGEGTNSKVYLAYNCNYQDYP